MVRCSQQGAERKGAGACAHGSFWREGGTLAPPTQMGRLGPEPSPTPEDCQHPHTTVTNSPEPHHTYTSISPCDPFG